jgi:hypothetical protein
MSDAVGLGAGGARKSGSLRRTEAIAGGLTTRQGSLPLICRAWLALCRPNGSSRTSPRPASGEGENASSRRVDFEPPRVTSPACTGSRSGSSLRQSVTCLRRERARTLCLDLESDRRSSAPARMAPHLLARMGSTSRSSTRDVSLSDVPSAANRPAGLCSPLASTSMRAHPSASRSHAGGTFCSRSCDFAGPIRLRSFARERHRFENGPIATRADPLGGGTARAMGSLSFAAVRKLPGGSQRPSRSP